MKENNPDVKLDVLAREVNLPKTSECRLLKQQKDIKVGAQTNPNRKRARNGKNIRVEMALNRWFALMTARGLRVSEPILLEKAGEIAAKLSYTQFKATNGWLHRWKKEIK